MKNVSLIISAIFMIFSFCGSATVGEDSAPSPPPVSVSPVPSETAAPDSAAEELLPSPSPAPDAEEADPQPSAEPAPAAPQPSPERENSIFRIIAAEAAPATPAFKVDMAAFYLEDMLAAAAIGDTKAGQAAEQSRNAAIDASGLDTQKISFEDLYLLARIICSEAGSDWLSEEFRLCVGEVVMNRVASPEYPDSIQGVVFQKGQYTGVNSVKFANMKPGTDCVNVALKLLQGERRMVPAVVYQSDQIQGELFSMYSDRRLGNTYFCLSPNLDLYP